MTFEEEMYELAKNEFENLQILSRNLCPINRFFFLIRKKKFYIDKIINKTSIYSKLSYAELIQKQFSYPFKASFKEGSELEKIIFEGNLLVMLDSLIYQEHKKILKIYQLNDLNYALLSNDAILINNKHLLSLSPFILFEGILQKIIMHDLSVLGVDRFDSIIESIQYSFEETTFQSGFSFSWDIFQDSFRANESNYKVIYEDIYESIDNSFDFNPIRTLDFPGGSDNNVGKFDNPVFEFPELYGGEKLYKYSQNLFTSIIYIDELKDWLSSIEADDIKSLNIDNKLKELEKKKVLERLYKKQKLKSKIQLSKSYKSVLKGLLYLLKKRNKKINENILRDYALSIVHSIFHTNEIFTANVSEYREINFTSDLLIDYILFLEKEEYFINDRSFSIPRILNEKLNINFKGKSAKNFYALLNKKDYGTTNIKDIKIKFSGLTSETALKNEMNY